MPLLLATVDSSWWGITGNSYISQYGSNWSEFPNMFAGDSCNASRNRLWQRSICSSWDYTCTLRDAATKWDDVISQTPQNGTTTWLRGIAFGVVNGSGLFVAVGDSGTILTSSDGSAWQKQPTPLGQNINFLAIAYANNEFVVTTSGNAATVLKSSDGMTWKQNMGSSAI